MCQNTTQFPSVSDASCFYQSTNQLFKPSLIPLDSWLVTPTPLLQLLLSFMFYFPWTFHMLSGKVKGMIFLWSSKSPLRPPLRLPSPTGVFQSQKWESSPFSLHSISMFPHFTSTTSFKGRINARMQQDEWFNLDSNCIKWANRNCWQKPYDEEAITCRRLPHGRRWEWSAGSQV